MRTKALLLVLVAVLLLEGGFLVHASIAGSRDAFIGVSATVLPSCRVATATPGTANVNVECPKRSAYGVTVAQPRPVAADTRQLTTLTTPEALTVVITF